MFGSFNTSIHIAVGVIVDNAAGSPHNHYAKSKNYQSFQRWNSPSGKP
jgi:hypothetical protein